MSAQEVYEAKLQTDSSSCYRPKAVTTEKPADGSMHFTIMKHPKEALEVMSTLRRLTKLCDVTLLVGEEKFLAHKIVLAAASPYFRAMFTGGMREEEMTTIPLHGITPCTLATLIEFAYTAEVRVSEMNVCYLLPAATMFQMNHVVEACSVFLEQQLDPSNCIGIADFSSEHGCVELQTKAREYIFKNFSEVIKCDEFLTLSPCQLINLIKNDELNIRCESEVFNAVIRYVQHDPEKRICKLEGLLYAVRCHFLSPMFLEKQLNHCNILKKMPQCQEYLSKIFQGLKLHQTCPEKPRKPCSPLVIFTAGGYLRQSLSNFEYYNPSLNQWTRLPELPNPRSGLCCCIVKGSFYCVGGRNNSPDGNMDSNALDVFDPIRNIWLSRSPMTVPRNRVGIGVIDNMIYAVGGSQGQQHHASLERYDPDLDRWTMLASMATKRIGVGVAVVNRLLFAVGGYDGSNRLRSMECYDPERDEWHFVAPMNTTRSGAGVIGMDGYVYAVGGYDSSCQLSSVERYCTATNQWEFVAQMKSPRSALSVAVINNKLYALGGYDGQEFLSTVERYDPDKNEWEEVTNMTCGRSGHGVAVGAEPCHS
uniref:BTB domain-containing protein n=3 Tax=Magallana gigas TaxID=29159 RepID=A0A8W8JMP4_MAGGI|nr:kelch-like ECH-associated protein 1 [Crassostrea gigas]XP_011431860.2 kelch-like ECH-associated protein 1 [Crassostrea gigas]XP_011431861.2 kelch-like ECH-associated protein 1 [Crassostrea gigas]XP_011431862.2 kelch-like ECH-associated protein 1 [Crassostrea gigas]XP_011431863.2 kelch-like ECH-associated protein 1 [Crassostrea gigas]XP_011431865.2 kelch-like ECH-associated protein 1 [Crassostrea gigas]XP_034312562.1 kelch-like ECH-associated protein 1 [Crassostrea gigas]XP_034312563.1 kel